MILTIAIPTYNRAAFLKRNLHYLTKQLNINNNEVEVIVSDNCSPDNTTEVVEQFISRGYKINYIKNKENLGPDTNIAQCYLKAQAQYVLVLGDDDILLDGAIEKILNVLKKEEFGVVFIGNRPITDPLNTHTEAITELEIYPTPITYLKKIRHYITFISANIVNKRYAIGEELYSYKDTNLIQVPFILSAILNAPKSAYITSPLLGVQVDNTGGYNLIKVFSENFNAVMDRMPGLKNKARVKKIIFNEMLLSFFPFWIHKIRTGDKQFSSLTSSPVLQKLFSGYLYYWLALYPVLKLPNPLGRISLVITSFYVRFRAFINNKMIASEQVSIK